MLLLFFLNTKSNLSLILSVSFLIWFSGRFSDHHWHILPSNLRCNPTYRRLLLLTLRLSGGRDPYVDVLQQSFPKKKELQGIILNTQHFPGGEDCYFSS
ncbi:hypothetical protein F8388_024677 [Cannabis sativa]|uniref:Uncharacterized protein n=1 Tax=Cannabis sativa TaxID=3483 RepID=A0A7J6GBS0_CANSA|nr:hypothetical protein F8388_024677 [Cannabis sativa]